MYLSFVFLDDMRSMKNDLFILYLTSQETILTLFYFYSKYLSVILGEFVCLFFCSSVQKINNDKLKYLKL